MKLFLYSSYKIKQEHLRILLKMTGKSHADIKIAAICNATDVEEDSDGWVADSYSSLTEFGSQVEVVDLRKFMGKQSELSKVLSSKDIIWLCGGNGYYLNWILKESGADEVIVEQIKSGKVYAGWSAGAVVAGPTLRHFEKMENLDVVKEVYYETLNLTDVVALPHYDMKEFSKNMQEANEKLIADGFITTPLNEDQALMIDGEIKEVI